MSDHLKITVTRGSGESEALFRARYLAFSEAMEKLLVAARGGFFRPPADWRPAPDRRSEIQKDYDEERRDGRAGE